MPPEIQTALITFVVGAFAVFAPVLAAYALYLRRKIETATAELEEQRAELTERDATIRALGGAPLTPLDED